MIKVIGVKFRCAGKLYYFDPKDSVFEKGEKVIVETVRGEEMGTIIAPNFEIPDDELTQPLKPIIRRATEKDLESAKKNREREADAFVKCKEKIAEHELEMKLVEAEYTYDGSKLIFYFTADGRIDFRELVKDLAAIFRTRIELRQIGVRDEAMIKGGMGICGRELCCKSYLNDFVPVSIKMAKEQNLSLNPTKISGVCGRLMCCLKNEEETYEHLNSTLPRVGDEVIDKFEGTKGTVQSVNVLRQRVKVLIKIDEDNSELKEYSVDEINFKRKAKAAEKEEELDDELVALENSEKKDEQIKEENSRDDRKRRDDRKHRDNKKKREEKNNDAQKQNNEKKPQEKFKRNRFRKNKKKKKQEQK